MTNNNGAQANNGQGKGPKASEILLELIDESHFQFFHDERQIAFCKYPSKKTNVFEIVRIGDRRFKSYLSFIFRQATGKTIGDQSLKEALSEMEGRALHDKNSMQEKVFIRSGEANGNIYLDMCDNQWRAIEISPTGWKVLDSKDIPIRFERSPHALALPNPNSTTSGDISKLWEIVNIPKEDQILILAFILDSYRCTTAFPILVLLGLQDSGKSSTQNVIRSLIDPSSSNLRTAPRKVDDLVTEAASNWLISYNNVSGLSDEMHDDFCCISTGSGFSTRKYFTNTDQVVVNIARPVAINGINNFIRKPDMLDRAIILELASIDEKARKTDSELNKALEKYKPVIFRGLLDLMVKALALLPTTRLEKKPRMADFALLGTALEKALALEKGTFIKRYLKNRADAKESVLESSPVMLALIDFIDDQPNNFWRGRPSDLLAALTKLKNPSIHTTWPKTPHKMSGELNRYIAPLKEYQIEVIDERKSGAKKSSKGNFFRIQKLSPQSPQSPLHEGERKYHEAPQETDVVDIDIDLPPESPTISTKSPLSTKPATAHGAWVSSKSVDLVDSVDIKTQLDELKAADDNSITI